MPYDTEHTFEETKNQHAVRLRQAQRWTKIRRRALLLKLEGLAPDQVQARMGASNCPQYLARAEIDTLLAELAVTKQGTLLVPDPGAEVESELAAIRDAARDLGLDVTVQDLTRTQARDSDKLALAQAGVLIGHPPFGYRKGGGQVVSVAGAPRTVALIVVDPEEARIVVYLFDAYVEGHSFPQIAEQLNAEGHRTRSGRPWSADTLRDMLRNPTYTGHVLYRGAQDRNRRDAGTLYPGLHPAIVPWETFCQAQDVRAQRHPRKPRATWQCPWENAPRRSGNQP